MSVNIFTNIPHYYTNFVDVFSFHLIVRFFKHTEINNNKIELINNLQLLHKIIYKLEQIQLKISKTYHPNFISL